MLKVQGVVYSLRDFARDTGSDPKSFPKDAHEYRVYLIDSKSGDIVAEWDSFFETYVRGQELSWKKANESMKEAIQELKKKKNYEDYFNKEAYRKYLRGKKNLKKVV